MHRDLLAAIATTLREKKQHISAADLIASETLVRALATLLGHSRPLAPRSCRRRARSAREGRPGARRMAYPVIEAVA